jgi:hypothetical protein
MSVSWCDFIAGSAAGMDLFIKIFLILALKNNRSCHVELKQ